MNIRSVLHTCNRPVNVKSLYDEHFLDGPVGVHYREVLLYLYTCNTHCYNSVDLPTNCQLLLVTMIFPNVTSIVLLENSSLLYFYSKMCRNEIDTRYWRKEGKNNIKSESD